MDLIEEPGRGWFVWTKKGWPPRYAHPTRELAETEAARLAQLHPGRKFHVLQGMAKVHVPAPKPVSTEVRYDLV